MRKKIVLAINYFYPDFASTGQLMTELCLELQDEFDLIVIAALPEGHKSLERFIIDKVKNIEVLRIKLPSFDKRNKFSRIKFIFAYFFFSTIAVLKQKNIDIVYTISSPPILGGLIGTIAKFFKGSKHIYNIQDFNPEQAEAISYSNKKWIYKLARFVDNINCRYADHVVTVGRDMEDTLNGRFIGRKIPSNSVINNWIDENEVVPVSIQNTHVQTFLLEHGLQDKFLIMYSGNLGLYYDLENLIRITEAFKDHSDLVFVFIGDVGVKPIMQKFVEEYQINNVYFIPFQPKEFIKYSLNAADVHLVVNQKGIKGVSVPSKIYGVMAAGKPIIGVLESGSEGHRLIQDSNCGIVVEPKDYDSVINAIIKLYKSSKSENEFLGANGRRYLETHLRKEVSIEKYRSLFRSI